MFENYLLKQLPLATKYSLFEYIQLIFMVVIYKKSLVHSGLLHTKECLRFLIGQKFEKVVFLHP